MVTISSDLAWALGMVPDCLLPNDEIAEFRDEYGGGWFWFRESVEGPRRRLKVAELLRLVQIHPKRTDNGSA